MTKIHNDIAADYMSFGLHCGANWVIMGAVGVHTGFLSIPVSALTGISCIPVVNRSLNTALSYFKTAAIKTFRRAQPGQRAPDEEPATGRADKEWQHAIDAAAEDIGLNWSPQAVVLKGGWADTRFIAGVSGEEKIGISAVMINRLDRQQKKALAAHEVVHLAAHHRAKKYAIATLVTATRNIAYAGLLVQGADYAQGHASLLDFLLAFGLVPIANGASKFVKRDYSRCCEYMADRVAAAITSPQAMEGVLLQARALTTELHGEVEAIMRHDKKSLFADHPPMNKRIAKLQALTHI